METDDAFWAENKRLAEETAAKREVPTKEKRIRQVFADRWISLNLKRLNKQGGMIGKLQEREHRERELVIRLEVAGVICPIKISHGHVIRLPPSTPGDITVKIPDIRTAYRLQRGHIKVPQQDGTVEVQEYRTIDAWRRDEIQIRTLNANQPWLSDMLLLDEILRGGLFKGVVK